MVDNYNIIELLNDFEDIDNIVTDIINDIQKNVSLNGIKLA